MKKIVTYLFLMLGIFGAHDVSLGQGSPNYQGGLKVNLNEDGSKYFRLISWHQMWATAQEGAEGKMETEFRLRRSRMLMLAQLGERFLVLTHFGLNNLTNQNMDPMGNGPGAQLFMHDAWAEYALVPGKLHVGGGLHYWNGISRLTNHSTLNFMTLDAPGHNWATMGLTDQFARHLGFYLKGKLGKLDYRVAINDALANNFHSSVDLESLSPNMAVYKNNDRPGGGKVLQGYFMYQLLEQESNKLPFMVGSYLGTKRVFNIGMGFFHHIDGTSHINSNGQVVHNNATSLGLDIFYDTPLGNQGAALTAYGSIVNHDWGPNLTGAPTRASLVGGVGTGQIYYAQLGYVTPTFSEMGRLQPYAHITYRRLDAYERYEAPGSSALGLGANWYMEGHHAKISLEYQRNQSQGEILRPDPKNLVRMQLMIYL